MGEDRFPVSWREGPDPLLAQKYRLVQTFSSGFCHPSDSAAFLPSTLAGLTGLRHLDLPTLARVLVGHHPHNSLICRAMRTVGSTLGLPRGP